MAQTIVVTGGTGGIGLQTAIGLAKTGATVVVTGRNRGRGERAVETIGEESGNDEIHLALGDLSSREQTRALASELRERFPRIDVLINNAGVLTVERKLSEDGVELDFAVNVAAPYHLTHQLKPALADGARVINVTGGVPFGGLDTDNLQAEKHFRGLPSYSHSKRALEAMSLELASELEAANISVFVVFPGTAATAMSGGMTPGALYWWMRPLWPIFRWRMQRDDGGQSAKKASRSSIWAATAPELDGRTGEAFGAEMKPMKLKPSVVDPANRALVMMEIRCAVGLS